MTKAKEDKKSPIKDPKSTRPDAVEIIKEESYDLTYFIPFDARNYGDGAHSSDRFIQYYSGMLIATEKLEREGVNLNINVIDEKSQRFENVLASGVNNQTAVIVGQYSKVRSENCGGNLPKKRKSHWYLLGKEVKEYQKTIHFMSN